MKAKNEYGTHGAFTKKVYLLATKAELISSGTSPKMVNNISTNARKV